MFLEYLPCQTFMHRLDIRTKLLGLVGVMVLAFSFNHPLYMLVMALLVSILAFGSGLPFGKLRDLLMPLAPVFLLIMLLTGFTYPAGRFQLASSRATLFYLLPGHSFGATSGGVLMGLTFLVRLYTMVIASSIVSLTTPIDDFIQLLNKLKFPPELSFMITTALRFIPTMDKKRLLIIEAQKARGAKLHEKGIIGPIKANIPVMVPMITNSILMANNLSMALLNRGYGYSRSWTNLKELVLRKNDFLAMTLITLITVFGLYLRIALHLGIL